MDTLLHEDNTYTWVKDKDGKGFWDTLCGNCLGLVKEDISENPPYLCPHCGESLLTKESQNE
jgi:DNA-directed RNA polymerase subunit RPC12/RpoP